MELDSKRWTVGLVGYGEVGRILAEDLRAQDIAVAAYDIKFGTAAGDVAAHARAHGVRLARSHAGLAAESDLVISAVTASQAVPVAEACAPFMRDQAYFLDLNSASPNAKKEGAECIRAAGARYVEGAVMTSVPPYRQRVPLLLGGPHAKTLLPLLNALGFAGKLASEEIGVASAVKMCRSVMVKGLEATLIESFTAARAYGVEEAVIESLYETFPGIDWRRQGAYFFQRMIEHGRRRGEEMREVARTVADAGLQPWAAEATVARQEWVAALADAGVFGPRSASDFARCEDWRIEADRILAHPASSLRGPQAG